MALSYDIIHPVHHWHRIHHSILVGHSHLRVHTHSSPLLLSLLFLFLNKVILSLVDDGVVKKVGILDVD